MCVCEMKKRNKFLRALYFDRILRRDSIFFIRIIIIIYYLKILVISNMSYYVFFFFFFFKFSPEQDKSRSPKDVFFGYTKSIFFFDNYCLYDFDGNFSIYRNQKVHQLFTIEYEFYFRETYIEDNVQIKSKKMTTSIEVTVDK